MSQPAAPSTAPPPRTPAASLPPAIGHVRVWWRKYSENVLDCIDVPLTEGMTLRELREIVAQRLGEPVFPIGFSDFKNELHRLDTPVTTELPLKLIIGPFNDGDMTGPFLDRPHALALLAASLIEFCTAFVAMQCLCMPLEQFGWRRLAALRSDGAAPPAKQLARRVYRSEGLGAFYKGGLLVQSAALYSVLMPVYLAASALSAPPPLANRIAMVTASIAQRAFVFPLARSLLPSADPRPPRRPSVLSALMWFPTLADVRQGIAMQQPALLYIIAAEIITTNSSNVVTWLGERLKRRTGVDLSKHALGRTASVALACLIRLPFSNLDRWITLSLPQDPWTSVREMWQRGLVFSFALDAVVTDLLLEVCTGGVIDAYLAFTRWRTARLMGQRGMADKRAARIILAQSAGAALALTCGLGALLYFKSERPA